MRLRAVATRLLGAVIAVLAIACVPLLDARAQQTPGETPPGSGSIDRHVHNYGDIDRSCVRWTDQCRNCSRGDAGAIICSNIGVACLPAEVQCATRREGEGEDRKK
jgi:hypothetical protein